jgi:hypothetical protein
MPRQRAAPSPRAAARATSDNVASKVIIRYRPAAAAYPACGSDWCTASIIACGAECVACALGARVSEPDSINRARPTAGLSSLVGGGLVV